MQCDHSVDCFFFFPFALAWLVLKDKKLPWALLIPHILRVIEMGQ